MSTPEEIARQEYADAGVDLPELKEEQKEEPEKEVPEETPPAKDEAKAPEPKAEDKAPSPEPDEPRKRSIYDDYKDKKKESSENLHRAEQAERERDELKIKLDALSQAPNAEKREEAEDDVAAYAKEIGADPKAISKLVELARKGMKPELPEDVTKDLKDFQQWKAENAKALEAHAFDKEFKASIPAIKEILPPANDEEMEKVRQAIDTLSHTKEYHDKPLDYIAFKNKAALSALISPRKAGLERKARVENEAVEFDFDPNADYSKLSAADKTKWEEAYQKMTSSGDGLIEDSQGRKTLL